MSAAKRKEVAAALQKLSYGDILVGMVRLRICVLIFAAPSLNSDNNLVFKLKAGKKELETTVYFPDTDDGEYGCMQGEDFIDLGKGEPLAIVNKIVTGSCCVIPAFLTR